MDAKYLAGLLLLGPMSAQAHAMLQSAVPAVGSAVAASPTTLQLNFDDEVDPARSKVSVTDVGGASEASGSLSTGPGNARQLLVPVAQLASGTYMVKWVAISTDSHRTQGSYKFRIAP